MASPYAYRLVSRQCHALYTIILLQFGCVLILKQVTFEMKFSLFSLLPPPFPPPFFPLTYHLLVFFHSPFLPPFSLPALTPSLFPFVPSSPPSFLRPTVQQRHSTSQTKIRGSTSNLPARLAAQLGIHYQAAVHLAHQKYMQHTTSERKKTCYM